MDPETIDARARSLYGEVDWSASKGLLHVAAIAAEGRRIIALGPEAPASPTDRFVLGLARARADLIVTTGAILRAEPMLVHCYAEHEAEHQAFASWRRLRLGRAAPPGLLVLSGSGDFPFDHPALVAASSGFVWTRSETAARLPRAIGALSIEQPDPDADESGRGLAGAIAHARADASVRTILVEAGPSTATGLYPVSAGAASARARETLHPTVDELLLSIFEGELAPAAVGPPFVDASSIDAGPGPVCSSIRIEEPSGGWRFERHRRR